MRIIQYSYPNTREAVGLSVRSPWSGLESEIDQLVGTALSALSGGARTGSSRSTSMRQGQRLRPRRPARRQTGGHQRRNGRRHLSITASRKQKVGEEEESFSYSRSVSLPEEGPGRRSLRGL